MSLRRATFSCAGLVACAGLGAIAPLPPSLVEDVYSNGVYPRLQTALTWVSNLVPIALLDVMLVLATGWWAWRLVRDLLRVRGFGASRAVGSQLSLRWSDVVLRLLIRTVTLAAAAYLLFLGAWGLNYRRVSLVDRLQFEPAISSEAAANMARRAVVSLNTLYRPSVDDAEASTHLEGALLDAFASVERALDVSHPIRPARPKRTMLNWYFGAAGVDGMTDPFFLETLVASDLLAVERPFVIAHEWSHLAGFADEGEANFLGWLACMHGEARVQYSGWLFLYAQAMSALPARDRTQTEARLGSGPRGDLRAIADRVGKRINPTISAAGWQAYDKYLKANRVEAGAASYGEFLKLVLGTRFEADWTPKLRR